MMLAENRRPGLWRGNVKTVWPRSSGNKAGVSAGQKPVGAGGHGEGAAPEDSNLRNGALTWGGAPAGRPAYGKVSRQASM